MTSAVSPRRVESEHVGLLSFHDSWFESSDTRIPNKNAEAEAEEKNRQIDKASWPCYAVVICADRREDGRCTCSAEVEGNTLAETATKTMNTTIAQQEFTGTQHIGKQVSLGSSLAARNNKNRNKNNNNNNKIAMETKTRSIGKTTTKPALPEVRIVDKRFATSSRLSDWSLKLRNNLDESALDEFDLGYQHGAENCTNTCLKNITIGTGGTPAADSNSSCSSTSPQPQQLSPLAKSVKAKLVQGTSLSRMYRELIGLLGVDNAK